MRCGLVALIMWLSLVQAKASEMPAFSGTIRYVASIDAQHSERGDQEELERLTRRVRERATASRIEAAAAPPPVAQVLLEDSAAWQLDLERTVLAGGGRLILGTSTLRLRDGRALMETPDGRSLADRHRGTLLMDPPPANREPTLAPLPIVRTDRMGPGEVILGRTTDRFRVEADRQVWLVDADPTLPNGWAMVLERDEPADGLNAQLARLPGLPLRLELRDGDLIRRLEVVTLDAVPPDESLLRPWR
jgi:hypothetical protein